MDPVLPLNEFGMQWEVVPSLPSGISLGWQPGCGDSIQSLVLAFAKFTLCKIQFSASVEWG